MIALRSYPDAMDVDLARTILSCMQNAKFDPALGSTNSLIASGDLGLIADPDIQRALTQWPTLAQVLIEWQEIERNHGEELILGETFKYLSWPTLLSFVDEGWQVSPLENDLKGLFSSKRFEGLLQVQHSCLHRPDRRSGGSYARAYRSTGNTAFNSWGGLTVGLWPLAALSLTQYSEV
jgi:hypothetical protein